MSETDDIAREIAQAHNLHARSCPVCVLNELRLASVVTALSAKAPEATRDPNEGTVSVG